MNSRRHGVLNGLHGGEHRPWKRIWVYGIAVAFAACLTPALANARITGNSGADYDEDCKDLSVPLPPPFNYNLDRVNSGKWTYVGKLDDGSTFAESQWEAHVFYFVPETTEPETPDGICVAFPRVNSNVFPPLVELLGIICQSQVTSTACFWDAPADRPADMTVCRASDADPNCDPSRLLGGTDLLSDVCTNCHAGHNAFLIHPKTFLNLGAGIGTTPEDSVVASLLRPPNWVDPLVKAGWPENPGPANYYLPQTSECVTCHTLPTSAGRFPELSSQLDQYCVRVLSSALLSQDVRTMPPESENLAGSEALFDACLQQALQPSGPAVGRYARPLYQQQSSRNPSAVEVGVVRSALESGDNFSRLQGAFTRPYFPKVENFSAPVVDGQIENTWLLHTRPFSIDVPVHGGRRNSPSVDQLKNALNSLSSFDRRALLEGRNDFRALAATLVPSYTPANLSAIGRALWDDQYLYVLVDVTDDQRRTDSGSSVWDDDSVEIYIDGRNEKASSYDENDLQFLFRPPETTVYLGGSNSGASTAGIVPGWDSRTDGYTLEVRFPWSTLGITPGGQIGFEVHVNDDDNGGERDGQTSWRTTATDAWTNPSRLSNVDLPISLFEKTFSTDIIIDGIDTEDNWAATIPRFITRTPAPIAQSNNTGYWRSFWDENFLYFFVHVDDSAVVPHDGPNAYDDDSIEIFIDAGNSRFGTFDDYDDFQFIFKAGEADILHWGDQSLTSNTYGFTSKSVAVTGGYNLEVAIAWTSLKTAPADGVTLGLEVQINDDDNGGSREGKRSWCSDSNETYRNPRYFCTARLGTSRLVGPLLSQTDRSSPAGQPNVPLGTADMLLTLDGNSTDLLWVNQNTHDVASIVEGDPLVSGTWQAAWNDEYLYFLFSVDNDGILDRDSTSWYEDDSVELYLSVGHSRRRGSGYAPWDVQYIFRPGDIGVQLGYYSSGRSTTGIVVGSVPRADGYDMEVAIPWTTLGALPEPTATLGLEVHFNDDRDGGNREGKVAWHATPLMGDQAYARSDAFAPVHLSP